MRDNVNECVEKIAGASISQLFHCGLESAGRVDVAK
jgi:hypothetical protein